LTDYSQLKELKTNNLLKQGYTTIIYQGNFENIEENSVLDLMISTTQYPLRESKKLLGHSANFVLRDSQDRVKFVIINSKVVKVDD